MKRDEFLDHYESLQVSPNADQETIERVFRFLAKRYHPDNGNSGDVERFSMLVEAHNVLSDPEKRAAYDATYDRVRAVQAQIRQESDVLGDLSGDEALRHGILSTLYIARRRNARDCWAERCPGQQQRVDDDVSLSPVNEKIGCHLANPFWRSYLSNHSF
jgi:curved DNA-binding protein CbpA